MNKIIKYLLLFVFLLDLASQVPVEAKPVPPGSGEGDVAANILFLIDSSASMRRRINNRDSVQPVNGAVYSSDGSIIASQSRTFGIVKFDSGGSRDRTWNNNVSRYTGDANHQCQASFDGDPGYTTLERDTRARHTWNTRTARSVSTNAGTGGGITNENLILFSSGDMNINVEGAILGISEDGQNCRLFIHMGFDLGTFDVNVIDIDGNDEHIIFASGSEFANRNGVFRTFNITRGEMGPIQNFGTDWDTGFILANTWRSAVAVDENDQPTFYYLPRNDIYGYTLGRIAGSGNFEITDGATPARRYNARANRRTLDTRLARAAAMDFDPDDDSIAYVASWWNNAVQKVQFTDDDSFTILERAGTGRRSRGRMNVAAAGALNANSVIFNRPISVHVTSTRVLIGSRDGSTVDVFDEDLFNAANVNDSWLLQMGGGRMTRWTGVKRAITAILSDTSLTTGAHFGYGHWNAGEHGGGRDRAQGGRRCHRGLDTCDYWTGWTNGVDAEGLPSHIHGRSTQCNRDHCFNVAPSSEGWRRILIELMPQGLAWGTDAKAFSEMAVEYFGLNVAGHPYDPDSDCQLNYIIVIGDGEMMNIDDAVTNLTALRNLPNPVKTLMVAYGGGISTRGMNRFTTLAQAGSCTGGDAASDDCEEVIEARTPGDLKSEVTARIRQILADRLSYTAPSITANVQEGGSLYQAQFGYQQFREWEGTILRKTLEADGDVIHEIPEGTTHTGPNWNAAVEVRAQAVADERNIWTTLPLQSYVGNWNNFTEANEPFISEFFDLLGYEMPDYHNTTSHCTSIGEDGADDDAEGLINFIRGSDFFDYDGDCNDFGGDEGIDEVRNSVLGDIYHSQLIEIGPPDANTYFTNTNEESYFRSKNNYQGYAAARAGRQNIVYAGSNSGLLHAFRANFNDFGRGGRELWAFAPPFILGKLPTMISTSLDGTVNLGAGRTDGGSNSIFGVDGSPVVHDVYMRGYDGSAACAYNDNPRWRTILFVPYGRGGAGFSVLDVTYPIISDTQGPCHVFSVYNDALNNVVLIADRDGNIKERPYNQSTYNVGESLEAQQADSNLQTAQDDDGWPDADTTTEQDAIAECQQNADAGNTPPAFTGNFHVEGTASCYTGDTFTFEMGRMETNSPDDNTIPRRSLKVTETLNGVITTIDFDSAVYENEQVIVTFGADKNYNPRGPGLLTVTENGVERDITLPPTNDFQVSTSCVADRAISKRYDYSQLGETWSAPRIFRIPAIVPESGELLDNGIDGDKYVAVFGAGMGNVSLCAGNAFFIVDLEAGLDVGNGSESLDEGPGVIYGALVNNGPITIIDTDPAGIHTQDGHLPTANASDIGNAMPSSPIVITPETASNIPWRGAMVYINDLEGKITKINLTNQKNDDYVNVKMFDQTTLFTLGANSTNARHSFFMMDVAIGADMGEFWLFGGTGNFNNIGQTQVRMDNILYGIKDVDYPYFKHLNGVTIPKESAGGFLSAAHTGAEAAKTIDNGDDCTPVVGDRSADNCPITAQFAWRIHLDAIDLIPPGETTDGEPRTNHRFKKLSAPPTVFKGNVYFPIYEPPIDDECAIGNAYICVADDECGTNNSHKLRKGAVSTGGSDCHFVREGILSELVIFGDKLFANVAGPKEDARTLYSVLAASGEVGKTRGSWREVGF